MAAVSNKSALDKLASLQKSTDALKKRTLKAAEEAAASALQAQEDTSEAMEYAGNSLLRFTAAGLAGAGDAYVGDTMRGAAPSEIVGFTLGLASIPSWLGAARKPTRSLAEGMLCGSAYRRGFLMVSGGGDLLLTAGGADADAEVAGEIGPAEEHNVLVRLKQEQKRGHDEARAMVGD